MARKLLTIGQRSVLLTFFDVIGFEHVLESIFDNNVLLRKNRCQLDLQIVP